MQFIQILSIILFLFYSSLFPKILIFTYAFNRPDFIELQYKTFNKFLLDDYEFVVFSDATTVKMHEKIQRTCNKYGIKCIRIPQKIHDIPYLERPSSGSMANYHNPSVRNCNAVQYSLNVVGFNYDDIVMLIDSDMFLVREFNIREYLGDCPLAGVTIPCSLWPPHVCAKLHPNILPFRYLWIGLVFLNMQTLPNKKTINFNCGYVFGNIPVDSGGYTAYYLKDNPQVQLKGLDRRHLESLICSDCRKKRVPAPPCQHNTKTLESIGLDEYAINFAQSMPIFGRKGSRPIEFLAYGHFVHYRGGTNYQNFSITYHEQKTKLFHTFINTILNV